MPWKLGSRRIAYDVPFTNEGTGIQYPANWMRLSNERDKEAIGMIWEEPEATNYDQRFYWSADNPKQLDDVTDEEGNTTTGLKTLWKAKAERDCCRACLHHLIGALSKSLRSTAALVLPRLLTQLSGRPIALLSVQPAIRARPKSTTALMLLR